MSYNRSVPVRIAAALAVLGASLAPSSSALAHGSHGDDTDLSTSATGEPLFLSHDEGLFDPIAAPFACGTEWSGGTRPGHGQNDWNLDFNRTSLDYGENRQHDLGQPLFAQGDGVVTYIGWQINAGTYLDIDYGDYAARYIHLVDDSVVPALGDAVQQGETIALLGDTGNTPGFAHLHLEYWDSRGFDDARIWTLKQNGQPQTEVTFDDNVVDPGEVIVSTNCVGDALAAGNADNAPDPGDDADEVDDPVAPAPPQDPLAVTALEVIDPSEGAATAATRLAEHATGPDPLQPTVFAEPEGLLARIDGSDLAAESVLVVAHRQSTSQCDPDAEPCLSVTRNGAPTAAVLEILDDIADAEPRRTVLFALIDDTDEDGTALASLLDSAGADPDRDALFDSVVAAVHLGPLGEVATVRLRNDALAFTNAEVGLTDLVEAPGRPTDLRWWSFHEAPTPDADADVLRGLDIPVISVADAPGPCATADNRDGNTVNVAKLRLQIETIAATVLALSDGDAVPALATTSTIASLVADGRQVVELMDEAGRDLPSDVLTAFLEDTPETVSDDERAAIAVAIAEALELLINDDCDPHTAPAPFTDVPSTSFAETDIALLFDVGITTGTSASTYSPANVVTREQMAAFLARVWRSVHPDATPTIEMPFGDVDETSFAYDDIRLLWELEITTGTSPTRYSPDDPVTREQMAAFLARVWRLLFPELDEDTIVTHPFGDVDETSFAYDDISLIFELGITTGTSASTYAPDDDVTREQMAAFLARVLRRHADERQESPDPTPTTG